MTQEEFEQLPKQEQNKCFENSVACKIANRFFTADDFATLRFCVQTMLDVNQLKHGEMCANILTGAYDRTEEFQRVLAKLSHNLNTPQP